MRCRSRVPPRTLDCLAMAVGLFAAGCGGLPSAGPPATQVISQQTDEKQPRFAVVDIDDHVVDALLAQPKENFRGRFPSHAARPEPVIGIGDSLVVTIWEAAGGGLFASATNDEIVPGSHSVTLPELMVARDGAISVPFGGRIHVAGRLPAEVQRAIEQR